MSGNLVLEANIGIGTDAFGGILDKGLAMGIGTPPTANPENVAQMWVQDQAAGNACFYFSTELGKIIKLYQQTHIADAKVDYVAGELDTEAEIIAAINTTNTTLNSVLHYLENLGFSAVL
jgi:hypothetical protein